MTQDTVNSTTDIDGQLCSELRERRRDGDAYREIADSVETDIETVITHVKGHCGCDGEDPVENDQPWRERAVMVELFLEKNLYFTEMSELLGCHDETARNWVGEHELSEKGTHHTSSKLVRQLQQMEVNPYSNVEGNAETPQSE